MQQLEDNPFKVKFLWEFVTLACNARAWFRIEVAIVWDKYRIISVDFFCELSPLASGVLIYYFDWSFHLSNYDKVKYILDQFQC